MRALTYRDATVCIETIFNRAASDGKRPICAAVTDAHGDLIAFGRMDGAPVRSVALSADKAFTAIYMDRDTAAFRDYMRENGFELSWFRNPRLTALPGGVRIADGQTCVGAIGISGRLAEEDHELAMAGVTFLKQRL